MREAHYGHVSDVRIGNLISLHIRTLSGKSKPARICSRFNLGIERHHFSADMLYDLRSSMSHYALVYGLYSRSQYVDHDYSQVSGRLSRQDLFHYSSCEIDICRTQLLSSTNTRTEVPTAQAFSIYASNWKTICPAGVDQSCRLVSWSALVVGNKKGEDGERGR